MLAPREVEVDRVEEAVRRIVERGAEGRPGALDQDVEQRRGHALGAEPPFRGHHRRRIAATDMKKRPDRSGRF